MGSRTSPLRRFKAALVRNMLIARLFLFLGIQPILANNEGENDVMPSTTPGPEYNLIRPFRTLFTPSRICPSLWYS